MDIQHCLQCELHKDRRDQDGYKYCYCFFNPDKGRWVAEIENCPKLEKQSVGAEKPVSNDLEEAAKRYSNNKHPITPTGARESQEDFIAGAKWDREKMMKDAVNTTVHLEPGANPVIEICVGKFGLKVRDKVKVIIIKEN